MEQNKDISIYNSVFRIGIVHSVDGRVVKVLVDKDKNNSHLIFQGQLIKNVAVGSYVKVLKGFETIVGKVESEYIETDKSVPVQYSSQEEYINRFLPVFFGWPWRAELRICSTHGSFPLVPAVYLGILGTFSAL